MNPREQRDLIYHGGLQTKENERRLACAESGGDRSELSCQPCLAFSLQAVSGLAKVMFKPISGLDAD